MLLFFATFQTLDPDSLQTNPILFGDFIKVGAAKEDKMYEELSNLDKVKAVLGEVRVPSWHNKCIGMKLWW